MNLPDSWLDRIAFCPMTGCWLWIGWWDGTKGYGKVRVEGRAVYVHRAVWELLVGPICPGLILDHRCRVRPCCNPAHLDPVTHAINTRRGEAVLFRSEKESSLLLPVRTLC